MSVSLGDIYTMRGFNSQLQFERGHAVLVLAFDLDLNFKAKCWPKFGTVVKFNISGCDLLRWLPLTTYRPKNVKVVPATFTLTL